MFNRRRSFLIPFVPLLAGRSVAHAASEAGDTRLKELARERLKLAKAQLDTVEKAVTNAPLVQEPQGPKAPVRIEELVLWSRRIAEAERDLGGDHDSAVRAARGHHERILAWQAPLEKLVQIQSAGLTRQDLDALRFFRLESESAWLSLRGTS